MGREHRCRLLDGRNDQLHPEEHSAVVLLTQLRWLVSLAVVLLMDKTIALHVEGTSLSSCLRNYDGSFLSPSSF